MVGLSVVLEGHHHHPHPHHKTSGGHFSKTTKPDTSNSHPQVINKTSMSAMAIHSTKLSPRSSSSSSSPSQPSFPAPAFLEKCFLCKIKLLPGKDIYMYKGDRAFCSVECRCRQIFMDEEETLKKENCSMAAIKPAAASSTSSSPSSPASSRHRRPARNHRPGGFAY
ncbi:FCS-Like Zinc finger 15-like [Punica granatum]|uniref:FLZ-type domain-containing protein n=2 Tax=Punica granatum TaxID=22663 RepID=A0A218WNJ8_PUNGR|nr:FCS-Like Zinc finger 15-like [Punica granatum]OWM74059.1 hypothetical protein CDL15_Pgr008370 [Punica granatum]PKI46330.1 hypothetical protein CRG98_033273 [Punica granatum]